MRQQRVADIGWEFGLNDRLSKRLRAKNLKQMFAVQVTYFCFSTIAAMLTI
jgi:hypothetical protein